MEYLEKYFDKKPILTFAWETNSTDKQRLQSLNGLLKKNLEDTTILVVIGYSFPFYNRRIDNEIFEVQKKRLKKIYFQDPNLDGEFLRKRYNLRLPDETSGERLRPSQVARLLGTVPIDIESIKDCEQFFVPVEL